MVEVTDEDTRRAKQALGDLDVYGHYADALQGLAEEFAEAREAGVAEGRRLEQDLWAAFATRMAEHAHRKGTNEPNKFQQAYQKGIEQAALTFIKGLSAEPPSDMPVDAPGLPESGAGE